MTDNILEFKKPTPKPQKIKPNVADASQIRMKYGYDPRTGVHALQIFPAPGYTDLHGVNVSIMSHKLAYYFGNSVLIFDNKEDFETFRKFHHDADFELFFEAPKTPRQKVESLFNKVEKFLGLR
jgi:hypothetical protein